MTVLHVIDTGGPGGAETVYLNVASGISKERFRSICVVSRDGWLAESLRDRGIVPIIVPAAGSFNAGYLRSLISIARANGVELIVAHLYGSAVYCGLAGLSLRVPVVAVLHGQTDIQAQGRLASVKRLIIRTCCRKVVFVSDKLKEHLAPLLRIPATRSATIPNGVDLSHFAPGRDDSVRASLGVRGDDLLIGAVGNIRGPKAYDVFLRAARILGERSARYRFAIAGEHSGSLYANLLALRSELKLDDRVTFLGLRTDAARVLRNFDVYVSSSSTEGFSISCIEAMATGIPVVATKSGGPEEIIENERSGLLVPTNDPLSLANAIDRLRLEPGLAQHCVTNASATVHERYALTAMLSEYEALFASLRGGARLRETHS